VTIKYTAQAGGYFRVLVDGAEVSKHTTEREALERAENEEQLDPSRNIVVTHDGYTVRVESDEVPINMVEGEIAELTVVASDSALVRIEGTIKVEWLAPDGVVRLNLVRIR
jgi:hypothetical protein